MATTVANVSIRPRIAINNILLTTDFSEASKTVIPYATAFAKRFHSSIYMLHVVPPVVCPEIPMGVDDFGRELTKKDLNKLLETVEIQPEYKHSEVRTGYFWDATLHTILQEKIDLLMIGTHGYGGFKRVMLGSNAEQAFRHAPCPVFTVGPFARPTLNYEIKRVVFTTDIPAHSKVALNYALALAKDYNAQFMLMYAFETKGLPSKVHEGVAKDLQAKLRSLVPPEAGLEKEPVSILCDGDPAIEIVRVAKESDADLIVMGVRKAGEMAAHLPFNVAHAVIANAPCPVLTIAS